MVNWKPHGIGRRFQAATLASVNPEHFQSILDYADNYATFLEQGRGILLSGDPGVGKTWAITALMKHLREAMDSRFDFLIVTAPDMFDLLDERKTKGTDTYRGRSWFDTLTSLPALVVNDLGKEDRSREWLHESVTVKLGRILRRRHESQLPIFITTNLPLIAPREAPRHPTVQSVYGDSIWSLIYDLTQFRQQVHAPDLRKEQVKEPPSTIG